MEKYSLEDMVGGWFVGDFEPSVIRSKNFEVAVKPYKAGDEESRHHHRLADELTVIISGKVEMGGTVYSAGDIVHIAKCESTAFKALEDTVTVVVKTPSVIGDKYEGEYNA